MISQRYMRRSALILTVLLMTAALTVPCFAYFNRGPVTLSVGQTSLSLRTGESASVSVNIQPIKEQQLPGCGMAECPQSCGSSGCLNEYGECTCAGTTYQTYYSSVSVTSENPGVASASYANGTLTVKGVSAGNATVTVTGSMRQYTDTSVQLAVTVKDPEGGAAPVQKASAPGEEEQTGVTVSEIGGGDQETGAAEESEAVNEEAEEDGARVIETKRGEFEIVELTAETDVRAHLQAAVDQRRHVTFQKTEGENVLYSLTFDGTAMDSGEIEGSAADLNGTVSNGASKERKELAGAGDGLLMEFNSSGKLAGPAEVYVRVAQAFSDGQTVKVLGVGENGEAKELATDLKVENGYVTFTVSELGPMLVTGTEGTAGETENDEKISGPGLAVPLAAGGVVLIGAAAFAVQRSRKREK